MTNVPQRWSERSLEEQIATLDEHLARAARGRDERSRCAASYLRVLLEDRRGTLDWLRRRRHARTH